MKYIFKKIYCATIVFVISLLTVFNCYAHENTANTEYNSEIVVEVDTYDLSCGSCGYRETIDKGESYTAYCLNSEGLDFMRTFEVRRNWTLAGGYEIHQCWSTWN